MAGKAAEVKRVVKARRRRFVDRYCLHLNATRAAKEAGYSGSSAGQIGYMLLKNVDIKAEVERRLEAMSMSAAEAEARLSEFGRGSFEPFLTFKENGQAALDLATYEAKQSLHLIRSVEQVDKVLTSSPDDAGMLIERKLKVSLHDSQAAVIHMLKLRGKFKEKDGGVEGNSQVQIIVNGGPTGIVREDAAPATGSGKVVISVGA